jgi:YVTN family beta-propeller protein
LRCAGIVAAVVAVVLLAATSASAAPLLWAVNSNEASVSTIEGSTGRTVGLPIQAGADPVAVALTPNGRRAYVANSTGESVTVIETGTRIPIATIPLGGPGEQVATSADGTLAYVTTGSGGELAVIGTGSNTVLRSIPVGPEASAVAVEPGFRGAANEFTYVGIGTDEVQGVNPAGGSLDNLPVKVGGRATSIAYTPDGKAAYVAAGNEVAVIEAGQVVKEIPLGVAASGIAMSPDGSRAYVTSAAGNTLDTIATATGEIVGAPIVVPGGPGEISLTANGKTAYVATATGITPVDLTRRVLGVPIARPGAGTSGLVVAPDQPPIAAFTPPEATAGIPTTFSASPSVDPDSSIATYSWAFSDGGTPRGVNVTHTYLESGTRFALLTLTDDEGCSVTPIFTGRTAYCNGSGVASVMHPVTVKTAPAVCSARFAIAGVSHNRRNGTVRVRLKFPSTGSFLLFGKKIHAVTRKVRKAGSTVVTLHARVELNKKLKKTLRAPVRYRITFTPNAGCGSKTMHRSVALLRAPRHKHHH